VVIGQALERRYLHIALSKRWRFADSKTIAIPNSTAEEGSGTELKVPDESTAPALLVPKLNKLEGVQPGVDELQIAPPVYPIRLCKGSPKSKSSDAKCDGRGGCHGGTDPCQENELRECA
jgi:hypothetical protein